MSTIYSLDVGWIKSISSLLIVLKLLSVGSLTSFHGFFLHTQSGGLLCEHDSQACPWYPVAGGKSACYINVPAHQVPLPALTLH